MRKAERLFQILTLIRGRRTAITAKQLSEVLEVSVRTIYRDIEALIHSGVPIDGEAGIGYCLHSSYHMPPLMFTAQESLALLVGNKLVAAWTDPELGKAAQTASHKILSVLPDDLLAQAQNPPYTIPRFNRDIAVREQHAKLRNACESSHKLIMDYVDANGRLSQRCIWPLGLVFWGEKWTLTAWCEKRSDYRHFRIDRIANVTQSDEQYPYHPKRNLKHVMDLIQQDEAKKQEDCVLIDSESWK